jgi:phage tail protein X
MKMVDAYVEASAKCDHILEHYAQTEFQITQAKADLAKVRETLEAAICLALPDNAKSNGALAHPTRTPC